MDISTIIEEVVPLVSSGLPTEIAFSYETATDLYCRINPELLESSVLNLIGNAKDAVIDVGTVKLVAQIAADEIVRSTPLKPGKYVSISIADSGPGVPDELIEKIFDPFFTTKAVGKGTGLGLASAFGFANECGGTLHYRQSEFGGAEFLLILPLAAVPADAAFITSVENQRSAATRQLLVVEDEKEFLDVLIPALSGAGHEVVGVGSLTEARTFLDTAATFDAVITDARLPDGNGAQLVKEYSQRFEFIVMSGNIKSELPLDGKTVHFLQKPFSLRVLIDLLAGIDTAE